MDRRYKITLAIFAVFALVLLWGEHREHLLGALPWLVLLACPLMHLFMHRGHGRSHVHSESSGKRGAKGEE